MDTLTAICSRISTRAFTGEKIKDEDLEIIINAAKAAPVGRKKYETLRLTVIKDKKFLEKISDFVDMKTPERPEAPFYNAPALIVVSTNLNSGEGIEYANAGCMIENMALAARALGIASVYLWAFIGKMNKELISALGLPEGYRPISSLAVGYPREPLRVFDKPQHDLTVNYINEK
jgi:Nitroreductase